MADTEPNSKTHSIKNNDLTFIIMFLLNNNNLSYNPIGHMLNIY